VRLITVYGKTTAPSRLISGRVSGAAGVSNIGSIWSLMLCSFKAELPFRVESIMEPGDSGVNGRRALASMF
jgi:hypothetical protein